MLIHNKFSKDNDNERFERLSLVANNIDNHKIELGIPDDKVEWAKNSAALWSDARVVAGVEKAEGHGGYSMLRAAEVKAAKFYCKAKALLKAILKDLGDSEELIEEYNLKGSSPRGYKKLIAAIDVWKGTHDRLVSEGDDRVVPDVVIAKLVEHRARMDELWHKAIDEKTEAREARRAKKELFDRDTRMLQYLFALCKLHWGAQDSTLTLLGFVTKSGIWTKKKEEEE